MRYLVLGSNGMAGHLISAYLQENDHEVIGFARRESEYIPTLIGDATDQGYLEKIIREGKYDAIVNCIGILNQDAETNKAMAVFLNSYLPYFLADCTRSMETQVIHISTDCVFSGKRGAYVENDLKDGDTFYARSKALGEIEDAKNLTIRTSIIGPDLDKKGIGLFNWFMQQEKRVEGYTKAIWTGQTTLQLAKVIEAATKHKASGLVNMAPEKPISKYELLRLINYFFRNDAVEIVPVSGKVTDKSLKRTNFDFKYIMPDYNQMLIELSVWIKGHKEMYPHYIYKG